MHKLLVILESLIKKFFNILIKIIFKAKKFV